MNRLGIDVGGTNTDAVLLQNERVIAAVKTATTDDVTTGIVTALTALLRDVDDGKHPPAVDAVMIGTTHFTNAVVQRRDLSRVAAVRIGLPASASLKPFADWPSDLASQVRGSVFMLEGGHEYDGRPIAPFDATTMRKVAREIHDAGPRSVAITSIFSPLTAESEIAAAEILRSECPDVSVTQSHQLGRIGLLERENATLLNACLIELARRTTRSFVDALRATGIDAPLFVTQNDGTVMRAQFAEAFPIYSFSSGPTNSMRGAAFLSQLTDAIVVDVGGTTTDVGALKAGFPREANSVVEIGGVRTLFRMPDILSIGLGGGSLVDPRSVTIGPQSVGNQLRSEALVFGGSRFTVTDVAVAGHLVELGDGSRLSTRYRSAVLPVMRRIRAMITEAVDRIKSSATALPLVAVGGAAFLVPPRLEGISVVRVVEHHAVANAVGAAIAQVSGEVDRIFSAIGRREAIDSAIHAARQRAIEAGAREASLSVVEVEDLPLAYLPGEARRIRVRVVGELANGKTEHD